jgi:hypothetical protein
MLTYIAIFIVCFFFTGILPIFFMIRADAKRDNLPFWQVAKEIYFPEREN